MILAEVELTLTFLLIEFCEKSKTLIKILQNSI